MSEPIKSTLLLLLDNTVISKLRLAKSQLESWHIETDVVLELVYITDDSDEAVLRQTTMDKS